jgi:hypothetical protein
MTDVPIDTERAHRWFAVEFNNRAWDLVELAQRSAAETEEMIHTAHAACLHWSAVGNVVNQLRAQCLLATAYATAGFGEAAVRHAEKCLKLCDEAGDDATTFDEATAFGCASSAYKTIGCAEAAFQWYDKATCAAEELDANDRWVFNKIYKPPFTNNEFWDALEYRLGREFAGMSDERFDELWCDGFIPEAYAIDDAPPKILGKVWIVKVQDQRQWKFELLLPRKYDSVDKIGWNELLPPDNSTEWLTVDWEKQLIQIEPSAAKPDLA